MDLGELAFGAAEEILRVAEATRLFFRSFEVVYRRMAEKKTCQFSNLSESLSFRLTGHLACFVKGSRTGRGDDAIFARVSDHGESQNGESTGHLNFRQLVGAVPLPRFALYPVEIPHASLFSQTRMPVSLRERKRRRSKS